MLSILVPRLKLIDCWKLPFDPGKADCRSHLSKTRMVDRVDEGQCLALMLKFARCWREGPLSCGSGQSVSLLRVRRARQFRICTARRNFRNLAANNNGDCVQRPSNIGRPSLTPDVRAVTGSVAISAFLPVFWFIEPTSGEVRFCAASPRSYAAAPG